jgi:hypothetical protein
LAVIGLDGNLRRSLVGDSGHAAVQVPVLAMSPTGDAGHQGQFDTTDGIALTWLQVDDACHQTFALGGCEALPTDEGYAIVQTWGLAFARRHLLGDTTMDPLLDGTESIDPRASVLQHD